MVHSSLYLHGHPGLLPSSNWDIPKHHHKCHTRLLQCITWVSYLTSPSIYTTNLDYPLFKLGYHSIPSTVFITNIHGQCSALFGFTSLSSPPPSSTSSFHLNNNTTTNILPPQLQHKCHTQIVQLCHSCYTSFFNTTTNECRHSLFFFNVI